MVILMPAYGLVHGLPPDGTGRQRRCRLSSEGRIRYVGIGAMLTSRLWTLSEISDGLDVSSRSNTYGASIRTRPGPTSDGQDAPFLWIMVPFAPVAPARWLDLLEQYVETISFSVC